MRFSRLLLILAAICLSGAAVAQSNLNESENSASAQLPALRGDFFQISSKETGRSYDIHIRLPEGYDPNRASRYPVAYILDGDSLFPILAATHLFLTIDDNIPEVIIVGVGYGGFAPAINKRGIDFMPPRTGGTAEVSGAPMFRQFLKTELLPVIEARYRADPSRRILFGQSRSGSFAIYAAMTEPGLFWGSIANNPALAPTRDFFYSEAASNTRTDSTLIVANGTRDRPDLRADTVAWLEDRKKRVSDPWTLRDITIQDGTHSANSADAYRAALKILFERQEK